LTQAATTLRRLDIGEPALVLVERAAGAPASRSWPPGVTCRQRRAVEHVEVQAHRLGLALRQLAGGRAATAPFSAQAQTRSTYFWQIVSPRCRSLDRHRRRPRRLLRLAPFAHAANAPAAATSAALTPARCEPGPR
jgi:hypothetical protein